MSNSYSQKKQLIIILFMVVAVLFRLFPHLPNFTPITAIALFGGVYLQNKKMAYIAPLTIMALSDLYLGFYTISIFVYSAFIMVSYIGTQIKKPTLLSIFLSSLSFFIITNFGVWLIGYPKTWAGIVECYTMALPFFRNSLLGDFFYAGLMMYGFSYVQRKYLNLA